jgi:heme exporter protein A
VSLVATDLALARGGLPVLADLSFRLEPGQALILRGPNGAGKTTLLRALAGLQKPTGGRLEGAEDRVAYAAHADGLKAMLSVAENLVFWAGIYGTGSIEEALAAYELQPLRNRLAGQLSAGQKRRLGLARLLVTGRPVWAMDEPTVSLDAAAVGLFAAAVAGHLETGGSAVIATHVDLGLSAPVLNLQGFRPATLDRSGTGDEAFL